MAIQDSLQRFQDMLQAKYPILFQYLLPGVEPAVLKAHFDPVGFYLPEELYRFYEWTLWVDFDAVYRDNVKIEHTIFSGFYPTPLNLSHIEENIFVTEGAWYWNFMRNDFGDFLVVEMVKVEKESMPIYDLPEGFDFNFPDSNEELVLTFANLEKFVDTLVALFESGTIYYLSADGIDTLDISDGDAFDAIGRSMNPGMKYWM